MTSIDSKYMYRDYNVDKQELYGTEQEGIAIRHLQDPGGHYKAQVDIYKKQHEFTTLENNDIYVPSSSVASHDTGVYSISTQTDTKPIYKGGNALTPVPVLYRETGRKRQSGVGLWWKLCLLLIALLILVAAIIVIVIAVDRPCKNKPCQNGGTCVNYFTTYECQCEYPYTGTDCQDLIDGVSTYTPTVPTTDNTTLATTAPGVCELERFPLTAWPGGENWGEMTETQCAEKCRTSNDCNAVDYYNARCWMHTVNEGRAFANFTVRYEKVNC